jgi:hypothetical protein
MLSGLRATPAAVLVLAGSTFAASLVTACDRFPRSDPHTPNEVREALFAELRPITLRNCELQRVGGPNDGGYLMCGNLLGTPAAAYSYGIGGEDEWGCELSNRLGVAVHQYDCFDPRRATCEAWHLAFHDECVGPAAATVEGRTFDSIASQIARNGHADATLLMKMDVEGAEWDSLLRTPDEVLARIDQLPMELHGVDERRYLDAVRKLKRTFHLVHLHFNNHACQPGIEPFPSAAYQVLWVNKRIGVPDPSAGPPRLPSPLDAPDNPRARDCQQPAK